MDQTRVTSCADVLATWPKIAGSRTQARAAHPTTRAQQRQSRHRVHQEGIPPIKSRESPRMILEDDEFEIGYIMAVIRHIETFIQSKDWHVVHVLVDNYEDEHVYFPRDFEWIAIEPSRNFHLVSASGHILKYYGEQAVSMKLRAKGNDRCATFSTCGGVLWHEEAGEIAVNKVRNHYELECWIKLGNVLAPVQIGGSRRSAGELAGHHVAVPQRTDAEILMDAQPQGAYAPRADEEHIEPEILPVASQPGPREPSKDEIEKHNPLHDSRTP